MNTDKDYNTEYKGDFLGFEFNGKHSYEFNIVRVITGSRQEENLLPSQKDTTITVPGRPGALYVKRDFQTQDFSISFAYDNLSEQNISEIRKWLSVDHECPLIYDERPYKQYMVKTKGTPKLSYIAFDAPNGARVYRGEGSVQFTAFYPYAIASKLNYSEDEKNAQWRPGSGLKSEGEAANYDVVTSKVAKLWNAGQIESPVYFAFEKTTYEKNTMESLNDTEVTINGQKLVLNTDELIKALEIQHVLIDSSNHLILGVDEIDYTNNTLTYSMDSNVKVLNNLIKAGDFLTVPSREEVKLSITTPIASPVFYVHEGKHIFYDYLYY